MFEHLLVSLAGSPAGERVLDHAEALAVAFHSTVTLLRATVAVEYLNRVAERLRRHNLNVNLEHPPGPSDQVIVERAAALGVSLILMTTHGRGGLGRLVFGSTADSVLRHA